MTDAERALACLRITMRGYKTEYGTPISSDVSVTDAIAEVVAAVRAETLREVRGVVEEMRKDSATLPAYLDVTIARQQGEQAAFGAVLASLDALAHPEGTA